MMESENLSNEEKLDMIEKRIEAIEKQIFGEHKEEGMQIVDAVIGLQNKLQSIITGREKITSVFSRIDELQKYLDPEFADNLTLSDGAKLELIFAGENKIRETVDSLQTVKDLEQYIDSEHIKAMPSHVPKLKNLHKIHDDLAEKICAYDSNMKKFVDGYNSTVKTLSEKFVLWDSILTQLEDEKGAAGGNRPKPGPESSP